MACQHHWRQSWPVESDIVSPFPPLAPTAPWMAAGTHIFWGLPCCPSFFVLLSFHTPWALVVNVEIKVSSAENPCVGGSFYRTFPMLESIFQGSDNEEFTATEFEWQRGVYWHWILAKICWGKRSNSTWLKKWKVGFFCCCWFKNIMNSSSME